MLNAEKKLLEQMSKNQIFLQQNDVINVKIDKRPTYEELEIENKMLKSKLKKLESGIIELINAAS